MTCPDCKADNDDDAAACFHCGKPLRSAMPSIQRGALIDGRYEVLSRLGRGGMGTVFKARDRKLDEEVALKVLRDEIAHDKEAERRFVQEIRLARRVTHRNVCRIHEYGEDGALRFISMELVEGIDLKRLLSEKGVPPPEQAYEIALQVAEGLQAIHDVGIVHRDLKTPNLMLDGSGAVKLMDFGIAKRSAADATAATATGHVVGTPDYMSPEQARGLKVDARSDVYAFGIVVFELFTGDLPFRGETPVATILRHISEPPPLDAPIAAGIPPALRGVLAKALAKDPEHRYGSVREMREALVAARAAGAAAPPARAGAAAGPARPPDGSDVPTVAAPMNLPTVALPSVGIAPTVELETASPQPPPVAALPPARRRFPAIAVGGGVIVLVVLVAVFSSRRRPPVAPVAPASATPLAAGGAAPTGVQVSLNALPWARVKLRPVRPSVTLPELTEEQLTTPCVLRLPEAEYEVELENGGITPVLRERIEVRTAGPNEFVFPMPDFEPAQAATRAERPAR
jgi:serine/threonine-protein kinase